MLAEISARMNASLKDVKGDIKSAQVEKRSTICAFWPQLKETIQHEMNAVIQSIQSELDKTTACNEETETEPNPGMMQSVLGDPHGRCCSNANRGTKETA
jgi:hypothetical protein